ncbi:MULTISPECIES: fimbrillin family protein [Bacteroides]|uniref:fimbrillin family protein n=1 Tax=Bacteroides TaxID=816 RepID=UPI002E8048EB|nr:fimbrillin family protein [Bacteroides fragilis]
MNKRLKYWIGCGLCCLGSLGLAGCSGDDMPGASGSGGDEGEPVALSFRLCRLVAGEASTRVDGDPADMADGKTFQVYAFPANAFTTKTQPLDGKTYTVKNGVATGELYLYRGTYDLYLVSYNSSTEVPELKTDGTIPVGNGKDFMYTTLKGIVVQPNQMGESHMSVTLPNPFKRMGAQVQVSVAGNTNSPVTPTSLVVRSFLMNGLCESLNYTLGNPAWNAYGGSFGGNYPFSGFTNNGTGYDVKKKRESSPVVLLPVDGTATIDFAIELEVGYSDNGEAKVWKDTYPASIQKVLLPGMTYQFDFTLTFYGILNPGDLTLAVRDYESTVTVNSDGLGKNK